MRALFVLLAATALSGCATTSTPEAIRKPPPGDPTLAEVRANLSGYLGALVRWGGTIAGIENRAAETWLDVVSRPLDSSGRPRTEGDSTGRFLVKVQGFLDPAVYHDGRLVTVSGRVSGEETRPIGEYPYRYIVVDAETTQLWEPLPERPYYYYRDPFYDPFYDPFWPARPYPWYWPYPYYPYWR